MHRLKKEKLSTPEALSLIAREGDVDRAKIAYAGLKDRQAVTDQFITIERRAVELKLANLRVTPCGTTDRPITSKQSGGNAYDRRPGPPPDEAATPRRSSPLVKTGFPNYFDDQRFGSLRHGQGFRCRECSTGTSSAPQQLVAEPRRSRYGDGS